MTETAQASRVRAGMKSVVRVAGFAVSFAAMIFVGLAIYRSFDGLRQQLTSPSFLAVLAGSAVAYAIALQLVGLAWQRLIGAIDGPSFSLGQALAIYGRTQIYKYLPSNVLHMVGRFALARRTGVSKRALVFAQVGEVLTIVLTAAVLAVVLARPVLHHLLFRQNPGDQPFANLWIAGAFVSTAIGIGLVVRFRIVEVGHQALCSLATAFVLYALFFTGSGLLVTALSRSLAIDGPGAITEFIGIGAAAWLVGFVVPGAPGGFGVREAVLIAGLSAVGLSTPEATAVALGYRLVTMAGDAIVAIIVGIIELKG